VKRLAELGQSMDRTTLVKLEKGERAQTAPLDKVFALAAALGVNPVHLLTPQDDDREVKVLPGRPAVPASLVRSWIRGTGVLPDTDLNLREIPEQELRRLITEQLTRGMNPTTRALMADKINEQSARIVEDIRTPEKGH
jgi:transcriptional regulator with XRE-family HTH domain